MDFNETIMALAEHAKKLKSSLKTEEATKTALILPFIQKLGYDIFNPLEVVPEFIADLPGIKGEKVDYAILQDGKPIIIIECKCCGASLNDVKKEQLHRYFLTLDSSIGILTDGINYLFYSKDLEKNNLDTKPFMEFSLDNVDLTLLPELHKFCKGKFDLKKTLDTVSDLKFNRFIKMLLAQNLAEPDADFIAYFMRKAEVKAMPKAVEKFTGYVKRALGEFVAEQVDIRLKNALAATSKKENTPAEIVGEDTEPTNKIITTAEEKEGFEIVKAIMSKVVDPSRVVDRDTASYFGILLDNKNTKPICRLHLNAISVKYIELFDMDKNGTKHKIESARDIYKYEAELRATVGYYDKSE